MRNLLKFFGNWYATAGLLVVYAVAVAIATVVEAGTSSEIARRYLYHAWWFIALNALLIVNFVAVSRKMQLWVRRRYGALLLHYGFVVVLIGAFVTHTVGFEGLLHLRSGESSSQIAMADGTLREIPVRVQLDNFTLERYRGSQTPSSYRSSLTIDYNGQAQKAMVSVNDVAYVAGLRIYQTSYDSDLQGTILTVNSDRWGTLISYLGYIMLTLGLFWAIVQRGSRFANLYSTLRKGALSLLFVAGASGVWAQVSPYDAERFGALATISDDGRVQPVASYASQIVRKLHHKESYKGQQAAQVLLSIVTFPEKWASEPILYIPRGELRTRLGGEYVTFNKFFNGNGEYILKDDAERLYALPRNKLSATDKDILKTDEKVNILYNLMQGGMLPLFPVEQGHRWLSTDDVLEGVAPMDSLFVRKALAWYRNTIDEPAADNPDVIALIDKYQKSHLEALDEGRIKAELTYNNAHFFSRSFRLYLIFGFVALCLSIATMMRQRKWLSVAMKAALACVAGVFLFQTVGIGLRWYISERAPWTNSYETMVYLSWITALAGFIIYRYSKLVFALSAMLAGTMLFVVNLNWLDPQITSLVPVLRSPWLMMHVSVVTASYGFFAISALIGLVSIGLHYSGSPIKQLRTINEMSIIFGEVLLTIGIFMGAVWANESWGRYWGWDPKESWALITMIIYGLIIHLRFVRKKEGDLLFSVLSVLAILSVLMTFFGVNYLLSGLHSYA